jgi:hypothetical protein
MVDIRFMAASSQPSHQERETEGEATSRSRAGQSRCASGHTVTAAGVASSQRQHSAGTTVTPPPMTTSEAMMAAARWLLNKPLPPHASPSAVEQWHHDVD